MAWTAPRTWADGTAVTEDHLNIDLRDNSNELAVHSHGGGSGSGAATLGNLTMVTMVDAAAPAAPGGTLSRLFSSGTILGIRSASGAARIFSVVTHDHTLVAQQTAIAGQGRQASGATGTNNGPEGVALTAAFATFATTNIAIGGTGSRIISAVASVVTSRAGPTGIDTLNSTWRLQRDSTILQTTVGSAVQAAGAVQFIFSNVSTGLASGTYTYAIVGAGTPSGTSTGLLIAAGVVAKEMNAS
jgi:hypothetical protein